MAVSHFHGDFMEIEESERVNNKSASKIGKQSAKDLSRMNFRLAASVKERVARAAELSGQDLTEFAVAALKEKADQVIERHDNLLLGSADYEFFLDALSEASVKEPSEKSRAAAERYRCGTRKGVRYTLAD